MLTLTHPVAGSEVVIHFPESREELRGFDEFLSRGDKVLCFDTETSGLDIHARGHFLRVAQFGNDREAWVLRTDLFGDVAAAALRQDRLFTAHNAAYDRLVVDRHLGVKLEETAKKVHDTRIYAHLLDPRSKGEGGIGLRLKELSKVYVCEHAADTEDGLVAEFRKLKLKKDDGYAHIPIDHETYVRYAGLDVIYGRRLFDELVPMVKDLGLTHLAKFEHYLAHLLSLLQRRGIGVDVEYVHELKARLDAEREHYEKVAARFGVENVNSTKQLSAALVAMGEIDPDDPRTERTDSGAIAVGKEVLLPMADLGRDWDRLGVREPNPLADAALRAKRAGKWATSYAEAFLELLDDENRIHPSIGGLKARTARMSVSRPPLQQLPSTDWVVRRALVADPGCLMVAADFQAVELRVLAALAEEERMIQAIKEGRDLHSYTAEIVFGPDFTPFHRKVAKSVNFGNVYGGGAATICRQTGAEMEAVKRAIEAYDRAFPGVKRLTRRLMARAEYGKREVVTPAGRHLPLDRDRLYAATNYYVQSTARDLLAQAIVDAFDAGLGDGLLLPVHDELLAQAPEDEAEEYVRELGKVMSSTFYGVPIDADPDVYGPSWGHGYGCKVKDGRCTVTVDHPHKYGVTHDN